MTTFNAQAYGPRFGLLLETNRCRPLGPGRPVDTMRGPLRELTIESAFAHATLSDHSMAAGCLAGVWLVYDFLDESHQISQGIETGSGSFWHAIMHRREGDFSNAKYWLRRVGHHPVYKPLAAQAAAIAANDPQTDELDAFAQGGDWDAAGFVDLCQRVEQGLPDVRQECELIQQSEWELLFDHCYQAAIA